MRTLNLPYLRRHLILGIVALGFGWSLIAPLQAATVWEYTVASAKLNNRNLEALLNSYAKQGWELVEITPKSVAIFRRVKR